MDISINLIIIAIISAVSIFAFSRPDVMGKLQFNAWQIVHRREYYRVLSYGLVHGSWIHLFINMFVLWMFGSPIERLWGSSRFAAFYAFCIVGVGVIQLLLSATGLVADRPSLGASGGVFAILLAFGMTFPNQIVVLLFPPIPMKAKYFVIFVGALELLAGVLGTQEGVANFAHLAGIVLGFIFITLFGRNPGERNNG